MNSLSVRHHTANMENTNSQGKAIKYFSGELKKFIQVEILKFL